jgi:hypothetical protein
MKRVLAMAVIFLRRLICRLFGHTRHNMSIATVGIVFCTRCLRIVDYRTVSRQVTEGDIERRMANNPRAGYSFVDCNWKKRKAKFVCPLAYWSLFLFSDSRLRIKRVRFFKSIAESPNSSSIPTLPLLCASQRWRRMDVGCD